MIGERGAGDGGAGRGRDEKDRGFAGIGIGAPDRGGEADAGKAKRDILDGGGVDVVATADDHVLGPAGDIYLAVVADAAEVAAAQPAFMEGRANLAGVEVAGKRLRPTREDFARRRALAIDLAFREHGKFGERDRYAAGAGALFAIVGRLREGAGEFRHAVNLAHAIAAPDIEEAPLDFRRADRGANSESA